MKKKEKMTIAFEEAMKDKKDYEPIHPHTTRMHAVEDLPVAYDAVSDAQGYGSRPSSPDFNEGPDETEQHIVATIANQKTKSLPAKITTVTNQKSLNHQEGV